MEVLLDLRFGVFYTHVPRICDFPKLTEYGIHVKIMSIQRFFFPKVRNLIVKLSKYSNKPLSIKDGVTTCNHQRPNSPNITFSKEKQKERAGPIYPSFTKYYFCKICYVNESKICLH